jgi:hypothetical protein
MLGYKHTQETKQKLKLIQSTRTKHPVKGIGIQIKDTLLPAEEKSLFMIH